MKLNRKGFSLLEIMVALGLLGAVSVVGLKIMSNNFQSTKTSQTLSEFNVVYSNIYQNFLNANSCEATLGNDDIRTTTIIDIKNKIGAPIYDKINKFGSGTLQITNIELKGIQNLGLATFRSLEDSFEKNPIPVGEVSYAEINLEITFEKIANGVLGGKQIIRRFLLRIEADENYKITKCFSTINDTVESTKEQVCEDFGGVYSAATGCVLNGGPKRGYRVKEAACEMLGGVYSSITGKCNTSTFIVACSTTEYLERFDLNAGTKVCKPLPSGACKPTSGTAAPDGKDNNCNGSVDEKTCSSGYTLIGGSICERVRTKPSEKGCPSFHQLGSKLGSKYYAWEAESCYKRTNTWTCPDTTNYWPNGDGFNHCELKRKVQVSRPCPGAFPNGSYSVNYCYIGWMPMQTDGACSGAPAEAKTSSSVDAVCYNVTPVGASDTCTSGYTFNTVTKLCEKKDQQPLMYY